MKVLHVIQSTQGDSTVQVLASRASTHVAHAVEDEQKSHKEQLAEAFKW